MTSAPTVRVVEIVEVLARVPVERLRFSDIVRELGITQATCHAILATLVERGWVSRDPVDKTYALGPALAVVAARADLVRPLTHAARGAALELSRDLGYPASVVERFGDSLVITAHEGADDQGHARIPDRIPYAPPFGVAFAAWDSTDGQRAWMRRGAATNIALTKRLANILARTRERGYDVDRATPAVAQALAGALHDDGLPEHVRKMMNQLLVECTTIGFPSDDPARRAEPVATISAPVFVGQGSVALLLCLHPLRPLTARQVNAVGRRLMACTAAIGDGS